MENGKIMMAVVPTVVIIFLLVIKTAVFFIQFISDARYIASEMWHTSDYDEYRYWRRKLRCHYLCLIPFVTRRNVIRLYHRIYHKPKHKRQEIQSDGLYHILAPSAISICICAICLCGASWAWFTASQTSSVANIQTATYTTTVTAKKGDTDIDVTDNNGTFEISLEEGCTYEITITPNGTAKSGYCKIQLGEAVYYTPQIVENNSFTFSVEAYQGGSLTITSQWGTCAATENIMDSETMLELGTKPENNSDETNSNTVTAALQTTPDEETTTPSDTTIATTETTSPSDTTEPSQSIDNKETTETDNTSSAETIQTATHTTTVTAKKDNADIDVTDNNGTFEISLEEGCTYEITITPNGTAKSGYCKIQLGEAVYYTPQIVENNSFTFSVEAYQGGSLTITSQWGTCAATENIMDSETMLELGTKPENNGEETDNNTVTSALQATPGEEITTPPDTTVAAPEATVPTSNYLLQ